MSQGWQSIKSISVSRTAWMRSLRHSPQLSPECQVTQTWLRRIPSRQSAFLTVLYLRPSLKFISNLQSWSPACLGLLSNPQWYWSAPDPNLLLLWRLPSQRLVNIWALFHHWMCAFHEQPGLQLWKADGLRVLWRGWLSGTRLDLWEVGSTTLTRSTESLPRSSCLTNGGD